MKINKDIYSLLKPLPMEKETLKRIEQRLEELGPVENLPSKSKTPSLNLRWYTPIGMPRSEVSIGCSPKDKLISISGHGLTGFRPILIFNTDEKILSCTVSDRIGRTWPISPDTLWDYIEDIIKEEEKWEGKPWHQFLGSSF